MSDGLVWNDCNLNGFAQEPDGTVWIGTSGGLSQFKPRAHLSPEVPIEVVFTKLVMGGKDVSTQRNPSFSAHDNSLSARYSALNVSSENRILFRYHLEGSSSPWTETTQRELQFAELAPGAYRLEIEAQDRDGEWSGHKAEFAFRILTPWYSSWWFVVICGLTPALAVGGAARLRMLSAQRREAARKVVEMEIASWKNRYETAVLASRQIIFDWDPVSREVTFGGALQEVLGYSSGEFTGATEKWRELIHPEDLEPHVKAIMQAMENKEAYELEYRVRSSKGQYLMMHEQGRLVLDEDGNVSKMIGFITDVSERRMLERQLRQAQKMEAVGRLAGGVAHDFNNLLTIIMGYSQILTQELAAGSKLYDATTQIGSAANRAAALTRQLLAFSRQQVLSPRIIDLNTVILNLDSMLRRLIGEDIEVLTVRACDLGSVKADPGQIEQVLINLALNARDAMPNGGKLTLETSNVELDDAYAREHQSAEPGRYVMLAVSDTGVGMSPEIQAHIFEPFYTTKETGKGTGLGLSTVYGIVKQSGGNIWVYSEPGRGTTFKVYLPRMDQPAEKLGPENGSHQVQHSSETILLVEDDSQLRQLTSAILSHCGYRVLAAGSADEALALCKANHREIELLITDVVMPGMNGRQLAEQVARISPQVKVLYISGYTSNAIVHHGVLDAGLWFLPKPFSLSALVAKVREVLDASLDSPQGSRNE
jgi:PAS domain S-box-containing protein